MKFLLTLTFLTMVCAIPRPGQIPTNDFGERDTQIGNSNIPSSRTQLLSQLDNLDESNENNVDDDEDDDESGGKISLDNLINALNNIRNALKQPYHNNQHLNNDGSADTIYIPSKNVPAEEDTTADVNTSPSEISENKVNSTSNHPENDDSRESKGPVSNKTEPQNNASNVTSANSKPQINITLIIQEVHNKIDNIIINSLRPWIVNNSVENEHIVETANGSNTNYAQHANYTELPQNVSNTSSNNNTASNNHVKLNNTINEGNVSVVNNSNIGLNVSVPSIGNNSVAQSDVGKENDLTTNAPHAADNINLSASNETENEDASTDSVNNAFNSGGVIDDDTQDTL